MVRKRVSTVTWMARGLAELLEQALEKGADFPGFG
jgi:hypothetical protein